MTERGWIRASGALGFFLCLAILTGPMALAQDLSPEPATLPAAKLSAMYDEHCMKTVYPELTPATREEFCACTAARVEIALKPREQQKMATGIGAPIDSKKLSVEVLAPCLAPPLEETEYGNCMADVSYAHFFKTQNAYEDTCRCVASDMAQFVQDYGHDLMAYLAAQHADTADDPLGRLTAANDYRLELEKSHNSCLNIYSGQ